MSMTDTRSSKQKLAQYIFFTSQPRLSKLEYIGNKIINAEVAFITGIGAAFISKKFGSFSDGGVVFINSSISDIPFTAKNPAFIMLLIFLLIALLFPSLKKIAEIAWDGAVFAFVSIMAAILYLLHNIDSRFLAEAAEVLPMVLGVALSGTIVYTTLISFVFYIALETEAVWARFLLGIPSAVYLIYLFS